MDALLREKMTQLTTKCDILQKNVSALIARENTSSALISCRKLSASRRMSMALITRNLKLHQKNFANTSISQPWFISKRRNSN